MPPKSTPARGQGVQRGRGRGRGASSPSLVGRGSAAAAPVGDIGIGVRDDSPSTTAIGMRRPPDPAAGQQPGVKIRVIMNSFRASAPSVNVYQYAASDPDFAKLPQRLAHQVYDTVVEDNTAFFSDAGAWFDGKAIMYTTSMLPFGVGESTKEFTVALGAGGPRPKVYKLTITRVKSEQKPVPSSKPAKGKGKGKGAVAKKVSVPEDAYINTEAFLLFNEGKYPYDENIQMVEMAVNTALRTVVAKKYVCNKRSFFTEVGQEFIVGGLTIRRGFFHSYRPSIKGPLINFDISTGVFYTPGPLIGLCLSFFNQGNNLDLLDPRKRFSLDEARRLRTFLGSVRLSTEYSGRTRIYSFRNCKFSIQSASEYMFDQVDAKGVTRKISVATYFKSLGFGPQYPWLVCIETGKGRLIPIEMFKVLPDQFARVELTPDQTKAVVKISTMRPEDRFKAIEDGFATVAYGQSEIVRKLGITISPKPIELEARVLRAPVVKCSDTGQSRTVNVQNGKWDMLGRKYASPATISGFIIAIFEQERYFNAQALDHMVKMLIKVAREFGMTVENDSPVYKWLPRPMNEKGFNDALKGLGKAYVLRSREERGKDGGPGLLIAVVPPSSADLYHGVKRFGDVTMGIATQCLLSTKAKAGDHQYYANVMLKINAKLGGTNFYPDLGDFMDPAKPTIIMGADAMHPPPGTTDKPSVTALVCSLDKQLAKYVATSRVQKGAGQALEIIEDMESMCDEMLEKWSLFQHAEYRKKDTKPVRLILFRDGVSIGEHQQVLDRELPMIRAACEGRGFSPAITLIVVGKRHHHRAMPKTPKDADPKGKGNVPAGTTIDTEVVHPLQFDYLQYTHGGILGTSRPGHYTVLHDDSGFNKHALQALSFGLAHSFARSTRSVSIPAPVYYADIVCARKAIYMDSSKLPSDRGSQVSRASGPTIEDFRNAYSKPAETQARRMFFM